jgi:beta-phosphoglucomutase-like phosphatase (HAD superfamily)
MGEKKTYAITRDRYDAVLFDLDGVITNTATIHATCWKQMFDEYLQRRATQRGEAYRAFDLDNDYRLYVDGKPRYDGVRDFLGSRGIQLPRGVRRMPHSSRQSAGSETGRTS